ncbi:DUF4355 domain-containing protein [Clostridium baratii]|uniref:DUF4355 domain-containing protein n=1 Tax=Clostridium baratii TaxID=1561 RepID=A0A174QRE0_9CLOT|nr:DUF4355 domain-containing protein [Clostridium baratii]CUP74501.1 Uncharacterised protein [Clostridium baratii]
MLKNELLELIKELDNDKEVDEIILSQGFAKPINDINGFNELLASNKEIQSLVDNKVTQGIDSFKKKGMQKLIEAEVLKRTGNNETEEQKAIRELKEKLENMEKEKTRAQMISKYKDTLTEKKIPTKLIDFVLGEDDETTNANITLFENSMKEFIETSVQDRLKGSSYTPPKNDGVVGKITWEEVLSDSSLYSKYMEQQKQ